jgi:hypothetical protein
MVSNARAVDPQFHPAEYLFRRVPTRLWDGDDPKPEVDAVELPDISVERSRYAHPEWARLDPDNDKYFKAWGVLGVKVGLIPPCHQPEGGPEFRYETSHQPLPLNYPHAEVRAYQGEQHLATEELVPEEMHLEWRGMLLAAMEPLIRPREKRDIRQHSPVSHELETV